MKPEVKTQFDRILREVREAAQKAGDNAKVRQITVCGQVVDGVCGFAWINIPGRGNFAKYAKEVLGASKNYGGKGYNIWSSKVYETTSQSCERREAACEAAANVLRSYGLKATMNSRLD